MNVAVIGGGLAGLGAAYRLSRKGHQVTVFEAAPLLGGQAATFEVGGGRLERFYHHIFVSDVDIINLIQELGLGPKLVWLESKVGFCHGGRVYDFVTPMDLLRFSPLSLVNRVRLGLVSVYLQRRANWRRFEGATAHDWIRRYAGRRNYDVVWGPLLRGKFGGSASDVGMVWFWGKMRLRFGSRGRGMGKERLGYLMGSFGLLVDRLAQSIADAGGTIHTSSPVTRVITEAGRATGVEVARQRHTFDAVITTVSSPVFLEMVPDLTGDYAARLKQARYQAAVCLVVTLKRPLSHIYWLNISDPSIPFVALIEHTNFIDSSHYGGKRVAYLSNYVLPDSQLWNTSAEALWQLYWPHLSKINPEFEPDWVEERYVFREKAAQPIVTTHYSAKIPEHGTPIAGLYLANTTQIYPEDRGMNYSLRLGFRVAEMIDSGTGEG